MTTTTPTDPSEQRAGKLYGDRDHMAQGQYYLRHVAGMTEEGLHLKSEIAAELAHRDMLLDQARDRIERLQADNTRS